jgi:hypothetical protein
VQGKALATLLTAAVAGFVVGCGGGDEPTSSTNSRPARDNALPPEIAQNVEEARKRVEAERQQGRQRSGQVRRQEPPGGPGEVEGRVPPAQVEHHDSGGGAAQFGPDAANPFPEFGTEASDSEREQAAAALHGFLDARAAHRWKDACFYASVTMVATLEQLARASQKQRGLTGCPEILAALSAGVPQSALAEAAEVDVGSLRAQGNTGYVLYHGAQGRDYAMQMAREGRTWKVSAPEAQPIS